MSSRKQPKRGRPSKRGKAYNAVIAERRARVSHLYRSNYAIHEISKLIGLHPNDVSDDLKALRAEWREARLTNMDDAMSEQLAKLDLVEREAHDAWEKSKLDAQVRRVTSGPDGRIRVSERRGQYGDPRFKEIILKCIAQRCKILGLEAPTKTESKTTVELPPSREELLEKLQQRLSVLKPKAKE